MPLHPFAQFWSGGLGSVGAAYAPKFGGFVSQRPGSNRVVDPCAGLRAAPDAGIAALPEPWWSLVMAALTALWTRGGDPIEKVVATDNLATQLEGCGQRVAADAIRHDFATSADDKVVRGGYVDPSSTPELPTFPGAMIGSSPSAQWRYRTFPWVGPGFGYDALGAVFGNDISTADSTHRYVELVQNNVFTNGIVGGTYAKTYPGQFLLIPKSWNAWVTPNGVLRGAATPFPTITVVGKGRSIF